MVKNGKSKYCSECGSTPCLAHKVKGAYMCHKCSGIPDSTKPLTAEDVIVTDALHIFGHAHDLYCYKGVVQDKHYFYRYWECGRKSEDQPYFGGSSCWEILTWGRYSDTERHIYYCAKEGNHGIGFPSINMVIVNHIEWTSARDDLPLHV